MLSHSLLDKPLGDNGCIAATYKYRIPIHTFQFVIAIAQDVLRVDAAIEIAFGHRLHSRLIALHR